MKKSFLMLLIFFCAAGALIAQPANCANSQAASSPFSKDGAAELCFVVTCMGATINSWNMAKVEVNGVDYTNKYADGSYNGGSWPAPINGNYYIYYKGQFAWSHFEMTGACAGTTPVPTPVQTSTPVVTASPTPVTPATPTTVPTPTPIATPIVTIEPTAVPTTGPMNDVGSFTFVPVAVSVNQGEQTVVEIHVNTGSSNVGAYSVKGIFPENLMHITDIVSLVPSATFVFNNTQPGFFAFSAFDASIAGIPGSTDLPLARLTIEGSFTESGTTEIVLTELVLVDPNLNVIGNLAGGSCSVKVINTGEVTIEPTPSPLATPTIVPTIDPTIEPTIVPTIDPTIEPTIEPTLVPTLNPDAGKAWLTPSDLTVSPGSAFSVDIHVNTGGLALGAFGFSIAFPANLVSYAGSAEIVPGINLVTNVATSGNMMMAGFNASGIPGGTDVALVRVSFIALSYAEGVGNLKLTVSTLVDVYANNIGIPSGTGSHITVSCGTECDVTPEPTPTPNVTCGSDCDPTPTPDATTCACGPTVKINPATQTVGVGSDATFEIRVNSSTNIGAFGFIVTYPVDKFAFGSIFDIVGEFSMVVNSQPGTIKIAGFSTTGMPANFDLGLVRITLNALSMGTAQIGLAVDVFADETGAAISYLTASGGTITVVCGGCTSPTPEPPTVEPTAIPTIAPTPLPTTIPPTGPGKVWIVPAVQSVANGSTCVSEIHVGTGTSLLAAYGIVVAWDPAVLSIAVDSDVSAMPTGFLSAKNLSTPGQVNVSGFDVNGKGPAEDIGLFQIRFTAIGSGTSAISLTANAFYDVTTTAIGLDSVTGGSITVE